MFKKLENLINQFYTLAQKTLKNDNNASKVDEDIKNYWKHYKNDVDLSSNEHSLLNQDIYPVPRDNTLNGVSSSLGRGESADVYEAVWNGKRVAAKVISRNLERELKKMQSIQELVETLPPNISKHFQKIYDIQKLGSGDRFVILAEFLQPLPTEVARRFFSSRTYLNFQNQHFKKDLVKAWDLHKNIFFTTLTNKLKDNNYKLVNELPGGVSDDVITSLINTFSSNYFTQKLLEFEQYVQFYSLIFQTAKNVLSRFTNIDNERVINDIQDIFDIYFSNNLFPIYPSEVNDALNYGFKDLLPKEGLELFNAINWLSNNNIMHWGDLHMDNIMIRPSTNDWVIIDFGRFSI